MVNLISENPLTVEADGQLATIYIYNYVDNEGVDRICKYIIYEGKPLAIVKQFIFDESTIEI